MELPLGEHEDVTGRFAALVERFDPEEVVIAGDLLHSFSTPLGGSSSTANSAFPTVLKSLVVHPPSQVLCIRHEISFTC